MTTPEKLKRRQMIEAVALIVIGLIMIVQQHQWYSKNSEQDKVLHQQITTNTILTECLSRLAVQITASTNTRSEAAEKRDAALVGSKKALRDLVYMRVIKGIPDSPQVRKAAEDYMKQTAEFIHQSEELDKVRDQNPPPEFRDFCPKVTGTEFAKGEVKK